MKPPVFSLSSVSASLKTKRVTNTNARERRDIVQANREERAGKVDLINLMRRVRRVGADTRTGQSEELGFYSETKEKGLDNSSGSSTRA